MTAGHHVTKHSVLISKHKTYQQLSQALGTPHPGEYMMETGQSKVEQASGGDMRDATSFTEL